MTRCCVFGCNNSYENTKADVHKVHFYKFPFREWEYERKAKWITFVKRKGNDGKNWEPTAKSVICSAHFIGSVKSEDPRSPSHNPTIHPANNKAINCELKNTRYQRMLRRLHTSSELPNNLLDTGESMEIDIEQTEHPQEASTQTGDCETSKGQLSVFTSVTINNDSSSQVNHHEKTAVQECSSSTEPIVLIDKCCGGYTRSFGFYGYESIADDEKSLKVLTSVTRNTFALLLNMLPENGNVRELTWKNRLLLFLMKLKTNATYDFLSAIFGVSPATAANTFRLVLSYIKEATKEWIIFPSKQAVLRIMPITFQGKYRNCRIIIDCTEIRTEKPPGVDKQVIMYSQYKGTWTAKYLLAINPCGLICFISKGYGGRATDSYITTNCGLLDKLEYGDMVLADKGFPNVEMNNHNNSYATFLQEITEAILGAPNE